MSYYGDDAPTQKRIERARRQAEDPIVKSISEQVNGFLRDDDYVFPPGYDFKVRERVRSGTSPGKIVGDIQLEAALFSIQLLRWTTLDTLTKNIPNELSYVILDFTVQPLSYPRVIKTLPDVSDLQSLRYGTIVSTSGGDYMVKQVFSKMKLFEIPKVVDYSFLSEFSFFYIPRLLEVTDHCIRFRKGCLRRSQKEEFESHFRGKKGFKIGNDTFYFSIRNWKKEKEEVATWKSLVEV